ncbi:MAG: dihydroorotate dehydrogenase [Candidatus Methanomethylophilaceae archaeon]
MTSLKVNIAGLRLKNPSMVASGIMDETGDSMLHMMECGAGAVVTKSIGLEPRDGHGNPTLVELEYGYINSMGLPNPGIDAFAEEMGIAVRGGVTVIGSIFASSEGDFAVLAGRMEDMGASAVELNLSCPHASGYGMEIGIDPVVVKAIVASVKDATCIPVFSKLTPNTHRLVDIGNAVQEAGGDGVVAINTLKAMAISPEFARPVLRNGFGGLSGPALKPVGVRAIFDLHSVLDIPLVGVGGIETWRDAAEYIMAGASAFQVGSAVGRKGPRVLQEICNGLEDFMRRHGYASVQDMMGVAHE